MRYLVGFFATIGVLLVLLIAIAIWTVSNMWSMALRPSKPVPAVAVLAIDLKESIAEETAGVELPLPFLENKMRLRDIVNAINRAGTDGRVKALVLHIEGGAPGMAQAQEIADAVQRFRDKGKFAIAWADTLGEGGPANAPYLLAAQANQLWVQPQGLVGLTGYAGDFLFFRAALDKIGVKYEVWKRKEYKSAMDSFIETQISAPVRENYESLFGDALQQLVDRTAAARKLTPDAVRATLNQAPLLASEALDAKLIDKVGYRDEADAAALAQAGPGAALVQFDDYRTGQAQLDPASNATQIALIYAVGMIDRRSSRDFGSADPVLTPAAMRKAFDEAIGNPAIKAIIFRIDSPGGSAVASESIRRDVLRAKAAGKKVVVSMGNVAASGGYWIAMDADKIVAQPGTVTGSIGVVGGKPEASGLARLIGIGVDTITTTESADLSIWRPSSPMQNQRQNVRIDATYNAFVANVAAGRKLPPEKTEQIARGRVWTGRQAKEIGLVDELGGMDTALRIARAELGLGAEAPVAARLMPTHRPLSEQILRVLRGETTSVGVLAPLVRLLGDLTTPPESRTLLLNGPTSLE
jgi:protease IV